MLGNLNLDLNHPLKPVFSPLVILYMWGEKSWINKHPLKIIFLFLVKTYNFIQITYYGE